MHWHFKENYVLYQHFSPLAPDTINYLTTPDFPQQFAKDPTVASVKTTILKNIANK